MNDKILISFLISMLAGLSTLIGCLFIFIKPKNINKFIGISLSFSATIMILISLLVLYLFIPFNNLSLILIGKV